MAVYEYESEDGQRLEVERPMDDAPKFGHVLWMAGVKYRRIMSRSSVSVPKASQRSARIEAWSLPNRRTMDPKLKEHVSGWNAQGAPCFDSVNQAEKWAGAERDRVEKAGAGTFHTYGDGPEGTALDGDPVKFDK